MANPVVSGLMPASGPAGTQVQINGTGFGATQGGSTVSFCGFRCGSAIRGREFFW
ncbi:MAG: IPT/TIG domain-containing protein [Acidobacteriia bacterium]|nr:IPT/TIG domain-containing protein [Terriglobia bacterium]